MDSEEGQKENDSGTATQARERRVDDSNRVKTSPPTQVTADRDVVNQLTQLRMKELLRKRMNASDHEVSKANKQITRLNPKVNGHEVEFPPPCPSALPISSLISSSTFSMPLRCSLTSSRMPSLPSKLFHASNSL